MTASPSIVRLRAHEIAIVGNDMMLAALPARPVQLAHAVLACGFDLVVPVSWGEELIAGATLTALQSADDRPVVFCACPRVRARLLQSGPELAPRLFSCVSPPVAAARYLRALQPDASIRITYLGGCEGARDPAIDARVSPRDFLRHLEASGVSLIRQSSMFDSIVPPDRRRHFSMPGGLPTAEHVTRRRASYRLVTSEATDIAADIADRLIADEPVLLDVALPLGCSCAGADWTDKEQSPRDLIASLEPPRASGPVVDSDVPILLTAPAGPANEAPAGAPDPPAPEESGTAAPPPSTPGVRSIEEARRRAERRRIAVTPANVRPSLGLEDNAAVLSPTAAWPEARSHPRVDAGEASLAEDATALPAPDGPSTPPSPERPEPDDGIVQEAVVESVGALEAEPTMPVIEETPEPRASPVHAATPEGAVVSTTGTSMSEVRDPRIPTPNRAWQVARIATPPRARSGAGFVPRAYASRRPRGSSEAEGPAAGQEPTAESSGTMPESADVVPSEPALPEVTAAGAADSGASVPLALPMPGSAHVNEYVTIKQRMAQRRLSSRPRAVPPVEEARGERLWRLLAYVLLILALTIATLAIVRR